MVVPLLEAVYTETWEPRTLLFRIHGESLLTVSQLCLFDSTGSSQDWFNQLPHITRFKYKFSYRKLRERPTTVNIDRNLMLMTITPASKQLHNVSARGDFLRNRKGEPFEIKRITV